ncbi:MAG: hypothetical protein JTT11_04160 [Candidatus Brockarchaeota archaeon]|nr:hypothetical protein [Candidatus Brockarchaeota archaeon]
MSAAGKAFYVAGLFAAVSALLLPWNGGNWKTYVITKWSTAGLGLAMILFGTFLVYRKMSSDPERGGFAFEAVLKYLSLSGTVVSVAMAFFSSWYQTIVLLFGVALNMLVLISTLRGRDFSRLPLVLLAAMLWFSFAFVVVWNFVETMLPNILYP